jgi:hypothetical protein
MAPNTIETLRLLVVSSEASILRLLGLLRNPIPGIWKLRPAVGMPWSECNPAPRPICYCWIFLAETATAFTSLPWLRRLRPDLPIVVLCDPEDTGRQKEATRLGAKDVLVRPLSEPQLESLVRRHLGSSNDNAEAEMASEDIESLGEDEFFLSVSPAMQKLRAQAELLAQAHVPVLILGEPGSGKGTVARLIHELSVYSGFKFLRVNCAEMPADSAGDRALRQREWLLQWVIERCGQARDWTKGHGFAR